MRVRPVFCGVAGDGSPYLGNRAISGRQVWSPSRASITATGRQPDGHGLVAYSSQAISTDSRLVAFTSGLRNLVPKDTNSLDYVFVRDRLAAVTGRLFVGSDGVQGNAER
jgi:hypothetical protein